MPHRVLFMISSMRGGGSERQTLLLLRHLDRSRFTPHLYVTERAGALLAQIPGDVDVHCFHDQAQPGGIYYPGRAMRQQVAYVRRLLREKAIDVIYDRTFHMTMIAGAASRRSGTRAIVPRVSTIVSPPEHALPHVERRFLGFKRRRLAKAYRQSESIVAVSRQAAISAERYYGLPKARVRVLLNPVDAEPLERSAAAKVPPRNDQLTLICVGRMTEEKGHRDMISAFARAAAQWPENRPPLRLWMVGDGPLRRELESQWQRLGNRHSIEFLGIQNEPECYVAAADALVLPSHFEGMPNVVLEAMALGTPVIATRAGGTLELERDEPTILWAQPRNPASLADAILQFAGDRSAACERAEAAKRMIQQHHDVGHFMREIEALLLAAIQSAEGSGPGSGTVEAQYWPRSLAR